MPAIQEIIDALSPVFEKHHERVAAAYLFGSLSRTGGTTQSDIDIAVLLYSAKREDLHETRLSLYADLCRALRRNDVDLVVLNMASNLVLCDEIIRTCLTGIPACGKRRRRRSCTRPLASRGKGRG